MRRREVVVLDEEKSMNHMFKVFLWMLIIAIIILLVVKVVSGDEITLSVDYPELNGTYNKTYEFYFEMNESDNLTFINPTKIYLSHPNKINWEELNITNSTTYNYTLNVNLSLPEDLANGNYIELISVYRNNITEVEKTLLFDIFVSGRPGEQPVMRAIGNNVFKVDIYRDQIPYIKNQTLQIITPNPPFTKLLVTCTGSPRNFLTCPTEAPFVGNKSEFGVDIEVSGETPKGEYVNFVNAVKEGGNSTVVFTFRFMIHDDFYEGIFTELRKEIDRCVRKKLLTDPNNPKTNAQLEDECLPEVMNKTSIFNLTREVIVEKEVGVIDEETTKQLKDLDASIESKVTDSINNKLDPAMSKVNEMYQWFRIERNNTRAEVEEAQTTRRFWFWFYPVVAALVVAIIFLFKGIKNYVEDYS